MSGLELIGGLIGAAGSVIGGINAKNAADTEAAQLEEQGKEEFAASQREAQAKRREGVLANSRVQALSAASGAGADAPTIVRLMTDTAGQAEYNAGTVMYGGIQRKKGLNDRASARRVEGQSALIGSVFDGAGQAFGAGSKYAKSTGAFG